MRKNLILLLFLSFSATSFLHCQDWIRIYGQGQDAVGRYITEDYDHGYIILGDVNNYSYCWLLKTDINGNQLHNLRIGSGSYAVGSENIEKTLDNGYILCGTWTKFNPSWDAFIIKLNACLEVEWCKTLITPSVYDRGMRVQVTSEGDYLLLGAYFITNPPSDISLFKFDSLGDLIWQQFYPYDTSRRFNDSPSGLLTDRDGYLITGSTYYPDPGMVNEGVIRSYFIKTDTSGNKTWDLVYGAYDYYYSDPWQTIVDKNSNYYHTCTDDGNDVNPALIKLAHNGTPLSANDIINTGNSNFSGLSTITILNDTNLIMGGLVWNTPSIYNNEIVKTDTSGVVRKIKILPTLTNGSISATTTFDKKNISILGDATGGSWKIYAVKVNSDLEYDSIYTHPFVYDSLCPHPIVSDTIDPVCDNVYVGISEPFTNPEKTQLKVYPNPAHERVSIEFPQYLVLNNSSGSIPTTTVYHQWKSTTLEVFDITGKKILVKEIIRPQTSLQLDVSSWQHGMYYFRLVYNKMTVAGQKVFVAN